MKLILNNPNPNRLYYALLVLAFAVLIIYLFPPNCSGKPYIAAKPTVLIKQKDSIRDRIVYKDRERIVYVTKYRTLKGKVDSIPCPEALNQVIVLTDSIIVVDSSLISSLKAELLVDSLIINEQGKVIKKDSTQIVKLERKLKRNRKLARFFFGTTVLTGAALYLK